MQNGRFTPRAPVSLPRNFEVVVAFDDTATSSTALKTCEYVIRQLGGDIQVRRKIFDFKRDTTPRRRAAAARDAARADMVIVAARDDQQLPLPMQEWVDDWSAHRSTDEGALVAILKRTAARNAGHAILDRLASVAKQAHMDFFSSEVAPAAA